MLCKNLIVYCIRGKLCACFVYWRNVDWHMSFQISLENAEFKVDSDEDCGVVWYSHYFLLSLPSNRIYIKIWHSSKPWKCFQFNYFARITLIVSQSPVIAWREPCLYIDCNCFLCFVCIKLKSLMLQLMHHTLKLMLHQLLFKPTSAFRNIIAFIPKQINLNAANWNVVCCHLTKLLCSHNVNTQTFSIIISFHINQKSCMNAFRVRIY